MTAECAANRLTKDMGKEGFLLKLSTRVRGKGLHGEMSQLIQDAFENLTTQAGKKTPVLSTDRRGRFHRIASVHRTDAPGRKGCRQHTDTEN